METIHVKIDFVTSADEGRRWYLVLVEGPWESPDRLSELDRLAKRIADTATAVLTGQIARLYPESVGQAVTIHVDSYDTPRAEVDAIIARARATVESSPEIQAQLQSQEFASALEFEHQWFDWQEEHDKREGPRKRGILERMRSWVGLGRR